MATPQYHRIIRKLVIGFGNLFDNITLVRYNPDSSEAERFIVPIAYAAKEHYVMRLEEDFGADKKVQMTLPRMSFEMTGLNYDTSRKQNSNIKSYAQGPNGVVGQYNPVPYNFDFSLYIYVRNIEDGTQVVEHILPYFTPDYTIKLNMIPEMGIVREVPIILENITQDITYEGDRSSDPRMIIWTLNFTVKGFVFGKTSDVGVIKTSITNILNEISSEDVVEFTINPLTGVGDYQIGEDVYQGYSSRDTSATAKVVYWENNKLTLTNVQGNFVSTQPIYGFNTSTNYKFTSYNVSPTRMAQIVVRAPNEPFVNASNTQFTADSSNNSITMDKISTASTTITESN
jgi:hypothetical protein